MNKHTRHPRLQMAWILWCICLLLPATYTGALSQSRYLTTGTGGTPMALSSDYRALGWNPGQLTFSPLLDKNWKSTAGGLEFGARLSSSVLERQDVWDGIWGRTNEESIDWSEQEWSDYVDLLSNESISINADLVSAASAKRWRKWAVAYANTQHVQAEAFFGGSTLSLLVQGGSSQWLSLFDAFLTSTGDTVANGGDFTPEQIADFIGGLNVDGDAIVSEMLQDTRLGFSWHRSHCIGIGKAWNIGELTLHTGISARLLLGNGYFSVQNNEDGLDAFGAFSNGFNVARIAALTNSLPLEFEDIRRWGPVGQGWGLDVGGVLEWSDVAWASASITDVGKMEWRGERYSVNTALTEWISPVQDPANILDIVVGAMDPGTWFEEADYETRVIPLGAAFQIGGGVRFGSMVMLAAEAAFDNQELMGNAGTRLGVTAVVTPIRFIRADVGISKWGEETMRVPAGLMIRTGKRGFECGFQASDVQALWKPTQPEVGIRMVAMRWAW